MSNNITIRNIGGIEDKEKGASLTGSSTLLTADVMENLKVVFDYGMFQGCENESDLNENVDKEALEADYIVITHAHMDHIGRLPLLIKNGFKGKIIMTNTTKQLASVMLNDYVKLTKKQIEEFDDRKEKTTKNIKGNLKIYNIVSELERNHLNKIDKSKLQNNLYNELKKTGFHRKSQLSIKQIDEILQEENNYDLFKKFQTLEVYYKNEDYKNVDEFKEKILKELLDNKKGSPVNKKLLNIVKNNNLDFLNQDGFNQEEYNLSKRLLEIENKLSFFETKNNIISSNKLNGKTEVEYFKELSNKLIELEKFVEKYSEVKSLLDSKEELDDDDIIEMNSLGNDLNKYELSKREIKKITEELESYVGNVSFFNNFSESKEELELEKNNIISSGITLIKANDVLNKGINYFAEKSSKKPPVLLYDVQDIYNTLSKVEVLEIGDEIDLDKRLFIKTSDDSRIPGILDKIKSGNHKKVYVLPHLKNHIISEWKKEHEKIVNLRSENTEFRKKLERAFDFVKNPRENIVFPEGYVFSSYLAKQKDLLSEFGIINKKDIGEIDFFTLFKEEKELKSTLEFVNNFEGINSIDENLDFSLIDFLDKDNLLSEKDDLLEKINEIKVIPAELNLKGNNKAFHLQLEDVYNFLKSNPNFSLENYNIINDFLSNNKKNKSKTLIKKSQLLNKINFTNNDDSSISKIEHLDIENILFSNNKVNISSNLETALLEFLKEYNNNITKENNKISEENNIIDDYIKQFEFYEKNKSKLGLDRIEINNLKAELDLLLENLNKINSSLELISKKTEYGIYNNYKEKLDKIGIKNIEDILKYIESEKDKYNLKYTLKDIDDSKKYLCPVFDKPNQKVVESIKLRFYEAGHIEGAVQAVVSFVTRKIDNLLGKNTSNYGSYPINKEYKNLLFTGDIGKISDPNLVGIPEIPPFKFDYVQAESTYAGREHPNKKQEFEKLVSEVNSADGKVLIAAFSLQRTQEILVELIQNVIDNLDKVKEYKILKKELKENSKKYENLLKNKELTKEEEDEKINLFKRNSNLESSILKIKENVFLGNITLDSPLSEQVSDIFLRVKPEKYKNLDPEYQKAIIGKQIIKKLKRGEYSELYDDKGKYRKDIVISSGGMLQGGAIINHLKNIISDPKAKLIFTGYQAENTIGGKIILGEDIVLENKGGKNVILIEGKEYKVLCKVVQVKGYSSHIGHSDLVNYLGNDINFTKNAVLSLTHGGDSRKGLAEEINLVKNNLNIIIPKLDNEVKIEL